MYKFERAARRAADKVREEEARRTLEAHERSVANFRHLLRDRFGFSDADFEGHDENALEWKAVGPYGVEGYAGADEAVLRLTHYWENKDGMTIGRLRAEIQWGRNIGVATPENLAELGRFLQDVRSGEWFA